MTLNRTISPEIHNISEIDFQSPKHIKLSNGLNVFSFDDAEQPIVRIEFVYEAGAKYYSNKRLPVIVNKLIIEGTNAKTSDEISTIIDYCGASLRTEATNDHALISLTVLHKHLNIMLPLLAEIINDASFPENEFSLYLAKKEQEIMINNQKVSNVARDKFPELLFGQDHVYGRSPIIEDYQSINRDLILNFYHKYYQNSSFDIYVSGSVPEDFYSLLETYFGKKELQSSKNLNIQNFNSSIEKKHKIEFTEAVQNAIRLGKIWPNRMHNDYVGLQVLITLFGGYFGSRLMTNIREDKGYTYGIGAGVKHFKEASFMFIATEVKSENYNDVLIEIDKEITILKNDLVSIEELNLVKSVMQGSFQRGFDGPFARADRFKDLRINELNEKYYQNFIEELKVVTPQIIQNLAIKYLNMNDFYELIVGKI